MKRREFIALVVGAAVAWPRSAHTQQSRKVPVIGVLWPLSDHPYLEAFRQGLRDLGYVEGQKILLEYRYARGNDNALHGLAAELVGLKVDVILTWGTPAALAAKNSTTTVPIVMGAIGDPVAAGLVTGLARPGGNITGLTSIAVQLEEKRFELLKEIVPRASRVAVVWNPNNPFSALALKQAQVAADTFHIEVQPVGIRVSDEFANAFATIARAPPDALMVHGDPLLFTDGPRILDFAARSRLPAIYGWPDFVDAGGLMAYTPSYPEMFRRAAVFVDKILKGANPADLPVEQPVKFELVINLKTAKALGLTIPPTLLLRADRVIE